MKYLKTFETFGNNKAYAVEELLGEEVFSEKCPDCNCDCDECDCDECDCKNCKGVSVTEKKKSPKKDKKEKEDKPEKKKGLTAKQRKLPEAFQKAILAKQK